ncbi:hypothetical protein Hanom_Chr10g00960761 [Helianthus anomalus]
MCSSFECVLLYRMAADVKIRKTPTTKARTLDNLLEDGARTLVSVLYVTVFCYRVCKFR